MATMLVLTKLSAHVPLLRRCCQGLCTRTPSDPCSLWASLAPPTHATIKQHILSSLSRTPCRQAEQPWGVARWFSAGASSWLQAARPRRLPFEVDAKVTSDTLLYTHTNSRFFLYLSFFGLAQLMFWGQLAVFSWTSLGIIDEAIGAGPSAIDKESFWGKIIVMQTEHKKRIAGICVAIGGLVLFFTFIYPRRTIQKLVLLRGGKHLQISTYTQFGKTQHFDIPVTSLSVQTARASKASQVSFKLKDHRFFYLMDKKDGTFHDTKLFDYAIGIKRTL